MARSLREILNHECTNIENVPDVRRHGEVANVMIVVQYTDGHTHCHLPPVPVAQNMIAHAVDIVRKRLDGDSRIIIPGHKYIDGL